MKGYIYLLLLEISVESFILGYCKFSLALDVKVNYQFSLLIDEEIFPTQ